MRNLKSNEIFNIAKAVNENGLDESKVREIENRLFEQIRSAVKDLNNIPGLTVGKIDVNMIDVSAMSGRNSTLGDIEISYFVDRG